MADMGSGFYIKTSTEALRSKADTVSGLLDELKEQCDDMYTRVNSTSSYWEGDGAEKRRSEYQKKQRTVERMIQRLKEYPVDLLEMAGIYEEAESENTERMQPLASDVII